MKSQWILLILVVMKLDAAIAATDSKSVGSEVQQLTDSIHVQEIAIRKLQSLYSSIATQSDKSALILIKKLENQERLSRLYFELANAVANQTNPPGVPDLTEYKKSLNGVIEGTSQFLARFPNKPESQHMLLLRAKTYQSSEATALAEKDYENLAFQPGRNLTTITAGVALIDLRFELGNFPLVLATIEKFNLQPKERYYGEVQIKKALALSQINQDAASIQCIQAVLGHLSSAYTGTGAPATEPVIKEAFNAAVKIYIQALNKKEPGVTIVSITQALSSQLPSTLNYTPMEGLTLQLISKNLNNELVELESHSKELANPTLEMEAMNKYRLLTLEHYLDQKLYPLAMETMKKLAESLKSPEFAAKHGPKLYRALARNLEPLRATRAKVDKSSPGMDATKIDEMDRFLFEGYLLALKIPSHPAEDDSSLNYNLAEVAYRLNSFQTATYYYLKAIATRKKVNPVLDLEIKAISSRYQELLAKSFFPKELKLIAYNSSDAKNTAVDPLLGEWIKWIDAAKPNKDQVATLLKFNFEAARALYVAFDTRGAIQRLIKLILSNPSDPVAVQSMLLVFDTYHESQDWATMKQHSTLMLSKIASQNPQPELLEKLKIYQNNSDFQLMNAEFQKKNYADALKLGQAHLTYFPASPHKDEVLSMMGLAALASGDRLNAKAYFTKVDPKKASEETKAVALANDVDLGVESFQFGEAATAYLPLIASSSLKTDGEKEKAILSALEFAWISQDSEALRKVIKNLCVPANAIPTVQAACSDDAKWLEFTRQADPEVRTLTQKMVGTGFGRLVQLLPKLPETVTAFTEIEKLWPGLNSLQRAAVIPYFEAGAKALFARQKVAIRNGSPMKLDKKAIEKRAKLLANFEKLSTSVKKIEWLAVQYWYQKTVALAYQDFQMDIQNLPVPKGFSEAEKVQFKQLLAQNAEPYQKLAVEYDTAAKAISLKKSNPVDVEAIARALPYASPNPAHQNAVLASIQKRNLPALTYLLEVAQKRSLLKEPGEKIQMAIILYLSGGFTESEQLFREANVQSVLPQFSLLDLPVREPAQVKSPSATAAPAAAAVSGQTANQGAIK